MPFTAVDPIQELAGLQQAKYGDHRNPSEPNEALQQADLAGPGRWDAFDSAVDEIVCVEPLTYQ
jgi:hypothetical protein